MTELNVEALAPTAIHRARLLAHQAQLAADVATRQALILLIRAGFSTREIEALTGISKSQVSRTGDQPSLGVLVREGTDAGVYNFADTWIWGSPQTAHEVREHLIKPEDRS